MKIRQGFVSNSSSSSFAVILPENFDPNKFVITDDVQAGINEEYDVEYDESGKGEKEFRKALNEFVQSGCTCEEDSYFSAISEAVSEYEVVSFDGSSGDGQIIILDRKKVKQALEKTL